MNTKSIIIGQAVFLVLALSLVYIAYPKASVNISGNAALFNSESSDTIIISSNPDFSNPRYIDIGKGGNLSFNLKPGVYYWKSSNKLIEGMARKFEIISEVGLGVENDSLVNIGNVRVNVTKSKEGIMMGYIILEPDEKEKMAENNSKYEGRQA
jgi:hypothetical protein